MLKFCLILSVISSIVGYDYPHIRPTYFYSPHHPIYQPSYHYPSYQPSYKYVVPHPLPVNRVAPGLEEMNDQFNRVQPRLFFGSQLSGVFSRGDIKGRVTVLQNMFLGNSGNNAIFTLSLDGGTTADTKYLALLIDDTDADLLCGPAVSGDRQTATTVDGNVALAQFDATYAEILGAYDVKRGGMFLKGSMLKHNVDGKGTYEGSYPSTGFLDFFNELGTAVSQLVAALESALAGVTLQASYTPATASTITGNKISAKGKWVVVNSFNSDYLTTVDVSGPTNLVYGCAKLE